ncbi:MAG TPA: TIM44-like domain-containing protein [Kofleriaceae bacterium]|nr:TIM44-like domain-containing protein [Kofleriaceae bacterium]
MRRRWLVIAVLLALTGLALARPGGGESFSGGGGHGGGGGGGGAELVFELIYWTLRLIFYYPAIGLPLLGIVIVAILVSAYRQHQNKDWDSGPPVELHRAITDATKPDPSFSQPVFEDFAFRLFATAHRARESAQKLAGAVGPYVSEAARTELTKREPAGEPVRQVVVGALRVIDVQLSADQGAAINVEYESNVATDRHTYYTVENWRFTRAPGVTSKPPSPARIFTCPNCGAPWDSKSTGAQTCSSCGQIVDNGRFDWVVDSTTLLSSDERPPTLTTEVPERGTDLPTYRQGAVDTRWSELVAADPSLSRDAFNRRVEMVYVGLNEAWSANRLEPVRGLVSDGLYDYLQYWVEAYQRQGLRNQLTNMRITRLQLAKVAHDAYYDTVTVRIWGTGLDYVVHERTGKLVRGSKHRERPYSEYWTFIRSAARKGPARVEPVCSNCGAPLHISQAGTCDHCGAHVTSGEFDWVLSKIEQDDTYRG